jgi:hypothetical protein
VLYFVRERNLIVTSGEVRCHKAESGGRPSVGFSNTLWDGNARELTFDVRSSCAVVDFFGGQPGSKLVNLTALEFQAALEGNSRNYTEAGRRIQASFGDNGEITSIDVYDAGKRDNRSRKRDEEARRREIKECLAEAREGTSFRLCGPDEKKRWIAAWRSGDEVINRGIGCGNDRLPDEQQRDYLLAACDSDSGDTQVLEFEVIHRQVSRLLEFRLECTCGGLATSRFHFDFNDRAISFNLATDATVVKFEGREFRLPTIAVEEGRQGTTLSIPVFSVQFNERWQVIRIAAIAEHVATASGIDDLGK